MEETIKEPKNCDECLFSWITKTSMNSGYNCNFYNEIVCGLDEGKRKKADRCKVERIIIKEY